MTKNIMILIALLLLGGLYMMYESTQNPYVRLETTKQDAPDFVFTDIRGNKHRLSDFKGKAIILNFWASWCTPCVVEFPAMLKLAEKQKENSIFIFISIDEDEEMMARFIKKHVRITGKNNVLLARDPNKVISEQLYQTYKIPETYFISPDLKIVDKIVGSNFDWNSESTVQKINTLFSYRAKSI